MRASKKKDDREELLNKIFFLLKQLEQDKANIARPYADIFSLTLYFWALIKLVKSLGITDYFRPAWQALIEKEFYNMLAENPDWNLIRNLHQLKVTTAQEVEKTLLQMLEVLIKGSKQLQDSLGISNVENSTTWPFPTQLAQLPERGNEHLLLKIAPYIDSLKLEPLKKLFVETLNTVISGGLLLTGNPKPDLFTRIPELNNRQLIENTFGMDELTTERSAEILQSIYPYYADFDVSFDQRIKNVLKESQEESVKCLTDAIATAIVMLTKDLLIAPFFARRVSLNKYLKEKVDFNIKYGLLNVDSLKKAADSLEKAHEQLKYYSKRNKFISYIINGLIFAWSLFLLFSIQLTSLPFYLNLVLSDIPLIIGIGSRIMLDILNERHDLNNVTATLKKLEMSLRQVFGEASKAILFIKHSQDRVILSSLKLIINQTYQELPKKVIGDVIEQALNRFNIEFLPSYSRVEFSLPADSKFRKPAAMKEFVKHALERAINIQKLKLQLKKLIEFLSQKAVYTYKDITVNDQGFLNCEYLIVFPNQVINLGNVLVKYGFSINTNFALLRRNEPYSHQEFSSLMQAIEQFFQSNLKSENHFENENNNETITSRTKTKRSSISAEVETIINNNNENRSISWPCGASYPSDNVKPVRGAVNQYIFWNLTKADFGEYKNDYAEFKAKSEQKASRAFGKAGIKRRPTLGTYMNKQRLFPAHVKVPGDKFGDRGVLLDVEQAATPAKETLYIARAYEPGIHKGIK